MPSATLNGVRSLTNNKDPAATGNSVFNVMPSDSERIHNLTNLDPPYPSESLTFLRTLRAQRDIDSNVSTTPEQARLKLEITIVGAGLGGIATAIALARRGHSVLILEQAPELGEVGAGIQIPPNSGRLLRKWGVSKHLQKSAVQPESINFRRWQDGSVIGYTDLGSEFKTLYEEPYQVVHRAHFHDALYQRAVELGVKVKLNSRVVEYDAEGAAVVLEDGSIVKSDLVIAADGVKSVARSLIHPQGNHEPRLSGFAAYRATVDVSKMRSDPEIAQIIERPSLNIWIGEDRHIMTYTIAGGNSFNMVLSHKDLSDPSTWVQESAVENMKKEFSGWDPKLIILGDAAHAMLPYMSEGAAMAVEDGAAIAVAINRLHSTKELRFALKTFEVERIKRSGDMVDASAINGILWHFADGPEQQARDAAMRAEVEGRSFSSSANQWSDPVTQNWAYGYDAEKAMQDAWDQAVSDLIAERV
ncbi:uncharacterized protein JN550_002878 [Neoarthrinium moseri]|uniref:uncharacterized protein n=1 Tax=Neoarthrinium moseri TaxID=1658444 RepID=UPI001FDBA47A|nr:uncharacterized protein JN550_002878 [Neoarthrinium moseri]KAI1874299.1 hypothetical protein JN550_002878 [Neoarthrinium moseri]